MIQCIQADKYHSNSSKRPIRQRDANHLKGIDKYIYTDVNTVEGLEFTYLDITNLDAISTMVKKHDVNAIVNCAAWTNVDGA